MGLPRRIRQLAEKADSLENMHHYPLNIILLGDPASGKGTQAARLVKKYGFYDLDMGKEVRKPAMKARFDYKGTTAVGKLAPTAVVRNIFRRVIQETPPRQGILFNGTPKMIGEAKLIAGWLQQYKREDLLVIYLRIPASETLRRTQKRREYVRGKLVKRDDDAERALKNRWRYYKTQISRVVAFFKKKYPFREISGIGSRAEVWKRIQRVIASNTISSY